MQLSHFAFSAEQHCILAEHQCTPAEHHCIPAKHHCTPAEHRCIPAEHHCTPAEHHCTPAENMWIIIEIQILQSSLAPLHFIPAEHHYTLAEHMWIIIETKKMNYIFLTTVYIFRTGDYCSCICSYWTQWLITDTYSTWGAQQCCIFWFL